MRLSVWTFGAAVMALGCMGLTAPAPAPAPAPTPTPDPTPQQCYAVAVVSLTYFKEEIGPMLVVLEGAMNSTSATAEQRATARADWEAGQTLLRDAEGQVERWQPSGQIPNDQIMGVLEAMSAADLEAAPDRCRTLTPPAGAGAGRSSSAGSDFTRELGVDRYGNDLRMVETGPGDHAACAAACRADARCRAFTIYTPPPQDVGYCWLKGQAGSPSPGPYSISGVRRGG